MLEDVDVDVNAVWWMGVNGYWIVVVVVVVACDMMDDVVFVSES